MLGVVLTLDGGSTELLTHAQFVYHEPLAVSSVHPATGTETGGTAVVAPCTSVGGSGICVSH